MSVQTTSLGGTNTNSDDIYVLTREGLAELTKEIFKNVNSRITERIDVDMDSNSDDSHVPSAKAVYDAISGLNKVKNLVIASGNINDATINPDPNTIYMVRKNASDTKGTMHIWIEGIGYIGCNGESAGGHLDLNVNAIPNDIISQIVSQSYAETDPGLIPTTLELDE